MTIECAASRLFTLLIVFFVYLNFQASSPLAAAEVAPSCPRNEGWTRLGDLEPPDEYGTTRPGRSAFPHTIAQAWGSPSILYVGATGGLMVSDTCGRSWVPVQPIWAPRPRTKAVVALTSDASGRIYVGFGSNLAGLDEVSSDGGATWQRSPIVSRHLAASPSSTGTVYGVVDAGRNAGFTNIGRTIVTTHVRATSGQG